MHVHVMMTVRNWSDGAKIMPFPVYVTLSQIQHKKPIQIKILYFASYITPFSQLRDTLGGVEYTPTIIVVFFNNDGLEIGKVEGDMKIEGAIRTGQMERLMRR